MDDMVTLDYVIDFLNELVKLDYNFTLSLIDSRLPCNNTILNHETIQVDLRKDDIPKAGFLGVLNGIFGTLQRDDKYNGCGKIMANVDREKEFLVFYKTESAIPKEDSGGCGD